MFMEALPNRASVMGADVEFARLGSGPALLYLHGCDGVDVSDPFLQPLSQHFEVVALSLPGFGASARPNHISTVDDLAEFCTGFGETLGLKDYVLCGSSFGGWVAAEMAIRNGAGISRLVLAGALGARFAERPDERDMVDLFTVPPLDNPYPYFADRSEAEQAFGRMDFKSMPEGAALRYCRNREALTVYGWAPLLHSPRLRVRLGLIKVPTLVIWGDQDRVVSPSYGRRYANAIPNAHFQSIENAGHYVPIEQPAAFVEQVVRFAGRRKVEPMRSHAKVCEP